MHQVHVLDERAAQGASDGISAPIGDQTASYLLLDLLTETLDPRFHFLTEQTPVEIGEVLVVSKG